MLKLIKEKLNYIIGPIAMLGLVIMLLEHTDWLRPYPGLIRRSNLGILCIFGVSVVINFFAGRKNFTYLRTHALDLIVFIPLIQFLYAPADSTLSSVLRQAAIVTMLLSRTRRIHKFITLFRLKPAQLMLMSFAGVIIFGTILLMLPVATANGEKTSLLNAFFTATSATCVTGLTVYDTATHFTRFGQTIILLLIQIGGLGIMTFSVSFALLMRRGISIRDQSVMQNILDQDTLQSVKRLVGFILMMTLILESIGTFFLYHAWRPRFADAGETLWHAGFHAISAFCNAGFSTFSDNLGSFTLDIPTSFTIGTLIIIGGIGFTVVNELYEALKARLIHRARPPRRFRNQTRLALSWTGGLILAGTGLFYWIERLHTLKGMSIGNALLVSLFQSITTRTAGFNTCDMGALQPAILFFFIILMFIGASPGGTGGGIKTTTPAVLLAFIRAGFNNRDQAESHRRSIPVDVVQKAVMVLCSALLLVGMATGLMLQFEPEKAFRDVFFETVSAFGTVGLSTGITGSLSTAGRILIILLMFVGRLGPLTIGFAFMIRNKSAKYAYAEERIMIG